MISQQIQIKSYDAKQIVEEQLRRNRVNRLAINQLLKSKRFKEFFSKYKMYAQHQEHIKKMNQAFKKAFKQIVTTIQDKNGQTIAKYYFDQLKSEFVRRSEFQQIKNYQSFCEFVDKTPKGVLVSQQLLQFTYRQIQKDIDKAFEQKLIKKITSSNKNKKDYYVFSTIYQRTYALKQDRYQYFGQKYFIEHCKENYKHYKDLNQQQTNNNHNNSFLAFNQKVNQWVPGYADLKKQWLLKNQQKQKQKNIKK